MIELEIQILSDRREGLLVELGRVVVASGFTLLRQRVYQDNQGAWLVMVVRGVPERQLGLEELLATHNRVLSFEATLLPPGAAAQSSPSPASRTVNGVANGSAPPPISHIGPDVRKVESMLPQLARDYPKIFPWLLALEQEVAAEAREASLLLAGRRTGTWVFKRDYAMGGKLGLVDAIKRIATPALRSLVTVDVRERHFHIQDCPLCPPGGHSGCKFFSGYLEGMLGASFAPQSVFVRSLHCRSSTGVGDCVLEVSH
jgi:predicted hydrocarbon binding protein